MDVPRPESERQRQGWMLIAKHARQMRRPMRAEKTEEPAARCEICGCAGNEACGHEPLDREMMCLLADGWCPCCEAVHSCTQAEVEGILLWYETEVEGQQLLAF